MGQVVIPNASDALCLAVIGLTFLIGGTILVWASLTDTTGRALLEGLGVTFGGLALVVSAGVGHYTPRSSPIAWLWVVILLSGAAIMLACCYQPSPYRHRRRPLLATVRTLTGRRLR